MPDWVTMLLTTSGPVGFVVAAASLGVAIASAVRQARAEKRYIHAKLGVKFVGVNRIDALGEENQYYQLRLVAAEGFTLTRAGLSYRSWRRLGGWVNVAQPESGLIEQGDTAIRNWLPKSVQPDNEERLAILATEPHKRFWSEHRYNNRQVKCWIEVGNYWIVYSDKGVVTEFQTAA